MRRELIGLLNLRGCRFEYGSLIGRLPRLEHDGSLWLGHGAGEREATYWPDRWPEGETELRAVGGGHYYGRFVLEPVPGPLPSQQARRVAVALAAQAAPPWTRPVSRTAAERPRRTCEPMSHRGAAAPSRFCVRAASRVPARPYGARQEVLTPV